MITDLTAECGECGWDEHAAAFGRETALAGEQVKALLAVECPACGAPPGQRCWQMIRVDETRAVRRPGPADRKRRAQRAHRARVDSASLDSTTQAAVTVSLMEPE